MLLPKRYPLAHAMTSRNLVLALWIGLLSTLALAVQARESAEDNGNVVVNARGDVIAVILCDPEAPDKCLIVEERSGNPLLMAFRESDDRYFVVNYKNGDPVGRIVRVGRTVWRIVQ